MEGEDGQHVSSPKGLEYLTWLREWKILHCQRLIHSQGAEGGEHVWQ